MILIQVILIVSLLIVGANFIGSRKTSRTQALKKLLLLLTIPAAIFVIMFPDTSTDVAHVLGVGRGADLLLYGLTIIIIFQAFDTYAKGKEEQKRSVAIVRRLAILEARMGQVKGKR